MSAYDKAVDLLGQREYTEKELGGKLKAKGYGDDEIDEALATLKSEGYLSDERFAEVYLRSRLRKTAEGRVLLMMRLTDKGVSKALASTMVNKAWQEEEYLPTLIKEWCKLNNRYGTEKAGQKLMQKGFSPAEIRKAEEGAENEN